MLYEIRAQSGHDHTMRCKVRYTPNSITLHLDVGAKHLPYERLKTAQFGPIFCTSAPLKVAVTPGGADADVEEE